jgi:large subunit ribosomal protein L4
MASKAPVLGGTKKVDLDDVAFGAEFHEPLVHESVRAELAARRQGTHATKTRGMVRGGGAKPWRQKGTGRARAGSSRSPVWVGGGTVFGPQPRHYTFKVNRKERRAALRSALSLHASRDSLAVLDPAPFADTPSTKQAAALLNDWAARPPKGSVLVVLGTEEEQVALSFRNLKRTSVLPAEAVGVADLVGASVVLASQAGLDALSARAKGGEA